MKQSKQAGFTLIELIIVIVILGILAVTASPKFLDIQGDARKSTLEGLAASLKGAVNIAHSKALVSGVANSANQAFDLDGDGVNETLDFQYPEGDDVATILTILDINGAQANATGVEWELDANNSGGANNHPATRIFPVGDFINDGDGFDNDNLDCYVEYEMESASGAEPTITVVSTGC